MDSILKLIIEKGPRAGETLEFRSGTVIRIGRVVKGNTLAIKDPGISSKHVLIEFVPEKSHWVLSDLDSSNGTFLNGNELSPTAPADLSDGDTIKLGELTSIKVQIESNANNQLRRNPRRGGGAAAKRGKQETVKLELVSENSELGLGENEEQKNKAVELAVEKPGRRGRPRKAVTLEEIPESSCEVVVKVEEMSNIGPVLPKQGRQVSTRRTRSSKKEESAFSNYIVGDTLKGLRIDESNLREPERLVPVADRRTRAGGRRKRNLQDEQLEELGEECGKATEKNSPVNDNLGDDQLENLGKQCAEGPVKNSPVKENLGHEKLKDLGEERGKASEKNSPVKENLEAEQLEKLDEQCAKVSEKKSLFKENLGEVQLQNLDEQCAKVSEKNSPVYENLGDDQLENLGEACAKESEKTSPVKENSLNLPSEAVRNDVLEEREKQRLNLGQEGIEGLATTSGVKDSVADVGESPNLEKMTLGDWFDYLEVNLPKEIYDATEEMILSMRKKADQFHEFMLQQKNARA